MKTDLTIVGAGIIGLMTAYIAVERGKKVSLIEQYKVGQGVSDKSFAFCSNFTGNKELSILHKYSIEFYKKLENRHPRLKVNEIPVYIGIPKDKEEVYMKKVDDMESFKKIDHPQEILQATPWVKWPDKYNMYCTGMGYFFYTKDFLRTLKNILIENEVVIKEDYEICLDNLHSNNGELSNSKQTILAVGPWSDKGDNKKVMGLKYQMPIEKEAVIYFPDDGTFMLPKKNEGLFVSLTSNDWDVDPRKNLSCNLEDLEILNKSLEKLTHLSKNEGELIVFCDNYNLKKIPSQKKIKNNIYEIYGASGRGFRFAPAIANNCLNKLSI